MSWLNGHTGGKLFLDWQGYARVLFPLASLFLWLVLAWSLCCRWQSGENVPPAERYAKIVGLIFLLSVPVTLYWAADPKIYPPANPDTGGPTGASLLESTLGIVSVLACFLVVPSLLAVIFGAVALNQMKHQPTAYHGRGMAIAGLVLGLVGLAIFLLVVAFGNVTFSTG